MTDTVKRADELIQRSGMSLYKFCETYNIPYTTINKTKQRGGNLSVETIEMLCQALDISMSDFFREDDRDAPCNGQIRVKPHMTKVTCFHK